MMRQYPPPSSSHIYRSKVELAVVYHDTFWSRLVNNKFKFPAIAHPRNKTNQRKQNNKDLTYIDIGCTFWRLLGVCLPVFYPHNFSSIILFADYHAHIWSTSDQKTAALILEHVVIRLPWDMWSYQRTRECCTPVIWLITKHKICNIENE